MSERRTLSDACLLQTKFQGLCLCHRLIMMLEILFYCGHKIELICIEYNIIYFIVIAFDLHYLFEE